jgi:integrase
MDNTTEPICLDQQEAKTVRPRTVGCIVKCNRHSFLALRIFWNGMRSWEGTGLPDTPENRKLLEAAALVISYEIKNKTFDYLKHFPKGNKAHLFRLAEQVFSPSHVSVEGYYKGWIKKQAERVRAHRVKDYAAIPRHVLKTRIDQQAFGKIALGFLNVSQLQILQNKLKAKGLKARSVNGIIHSCLRAMLRDARIDGLIKVNLYDRAFFKPLSITDSKPSIDPYPPEEREIILEAFRTMRAHYYRFVFFQFWQGTRPSEAIALRRADVDLRYATAGIHKSIVQGHEGGTKTVRSNRQIHLHDNVVRILSEENPAPLSVRPDDFLFTTPEGTPIDESNFYKREWLPILRAKKITSRPFYNTRHSYVSFLYSIGAKSGFISSQTGDSIKTLESDYAKYIKEADDNRDFVENQIQKSATLVKPASHVDHSPAPSEKKKPLISQGLKTGAGEEGRTPDLMLGKHTL